MSSALKDNRRIAKNTLMLYIRMLLIMVVSLYTSRIILGVLGVEDFGIYNVVGGVVAMVSFWKSGGNINFISLEFNSLFVFHFSSYIFCRNYWALVCQ